MMTSITDIQNYKRCRRRWLWQSSSRGNLQKLGTGKPALELGSLAHAALADWTTNPKAISQLDGTVMTLEDMFLTHSANRVRTIRKEYRERIGAKISDVELAPMYESIELGRHMMINYQEHWKSPLPDDFTFALPEQEIVVEIPGTEFNCCIIKGDSSCPSCRGTGVGRHKLRAILDGLIKRKDDVYFCLERKTVSPRFRPTKEHLRRTDQFVGYTWLMRQLDIEKIGGVAYDGLIKQKAPSKTGNYTKLSDLFIRTVIPFSPDELDQWGENLARVVNEMASITENDCYPNIPWNGCDDCPFLQPCDMVNRGEDVNVLLNQSYFLRPDRRPILSIGEEVLA